MRIKLNLRLQYKVEGEEPPVEGVVTKQTLETFHQGDGIKIYNNNIGNATIPNRLVDGNLTTNYWPGGNQYTPHKHVVEFGGVFRISHVILHIGQNSATVTVGYGNNPFDLTETVVELASFSNQTVNLNVNAKFLVLKYPVQATVKDGPAELEVFGYMVAKDPVPPRVLSSPKMYQDTIGSNGNEYAYTGQREGGVDIAEDLYPYPGATFREYDLGLLFLRPEGIRFSPNWQNVRMDKHYQEMKAKGIKTLPLIFNMPATIFKASYDAAGAFWSERVPPVQYGLDPRDPASYTEVANLFQQFTYRYGRNVVDESLITIDQTQVYPDPLWKNYPVSGLDLIEWIEIGNEHNQWWGNPAEQWEPDIHYAFMRAIYNAIKEADPTMQVVMPALADIGIETVKIFKHLADRDGLPVPFDVINLHGYFTTTGNQYSGENSKGIAPELFMGVGIAQFFKDATEWFQRYLPGKKIIHSEWGYDSNHISMVGVPLLTNAQRLAAAYPLDSLRQQAAYIARAQAEMWTISEYLDGNIQYEVWNETNIDEVAEQDTSTTNNVAAYRDPWSGGIQFATSGLVKGQYATQSYGKKPAWYVNHNQYLAKKNCIFIEDRSTVNYRHFVGRQEGVKEVHYFVKPTQDGSQLNNVTINIGRNTANLVTLESEHNTQTLPTTPLTVTSQSITININEMPKFVICPL